MDKKFQKIFAVGDIHGCLDELEELVKKLPLDRESAIVFLGDYIDRGPSSKQVIEYILKLKQNYSVFTIKGNHEAMFRDFLDAPDSTGAILFIINGGTQTLLSYQDEKDPRGFNVPIEQRKFLADLPDHLILQDFIFVHAGLPELPLKEALSDEYAMERVWIRHPFLESQFNWDKIVVHGHTPMREVSILENRINVDSGCVFGNKLSAIELYSMEVYSVNGFQQKQNSFWTSLQKAQNVGNRRAAPRYQGRIAVIIEKKNVQMETLNYNEIGLLLREESLEPSLNINEKFTARIGEDPRIQTTILGQVVRAEESEDAFLYGVKIIEIKES